MLIMISSGLLYNSKRKQKKENFGWSADPSQSYSCEQTAIVFLITKKLLISDIMLHMIQTPSQQQTPPQL